MVTKTTFWIALAGLAFALAAFICSYLFLRDAVGDWRGMIVAAPLTAFGCGALCWWFFVGRGQKASVWRGVWVGALAALLSHLLVWYFSILYFYLAGEPGTLNPIEGIWASLLYGLLGLIFIGWLTLPMAALTGGLLAFAQAKLAPRSERSLSVGSSGPTPAE